MNAQWARDEEQLFIQLIVDIVIAKGNKNKAPFFFAKDGWKEMCKKLYHRMVKKYSPKQLKNKLTLFKEPLYNLPKFDEEVTGWDHILGTFNASDQW